jgi:hypothetical protein
MHLHYTRLTSKPWLKHYFISCCLQSGKKIQLHQILPPSKSPPNTLNSSDENHSFSPASSVATAPASSQPESTLQDPPIGPQAITNLTTVESNTIEPMSHNNSTPVSMAIGIEPNDISTWSVLQKRMSLDCQFMQPAEIPAAFIGNNSRQTSKTIF